MRIILAVSLAVIVALLFVASMLVAAMDAQGAIAYLLSLPLCAILLWTAHRLSRKQLVPRTLILAESAFLAAFVMSVFVPPLRAFANFMVSGAAAGFESLVGLSPYAWAKQRNPEAAQLKEQLQKARTEVSLAQVSVFANWNRLCIFGPYSTEDDAARALGYRSATLEQSRVRNSNAVSALVFVNDSGTLGIIDVDRSLVDFAQLSQICLKPSDFPVPLDGAFGHRVARAPNRRTP
jgi:hypothetical protein